MALRPSQPVNATGHVTEFETGLSFDDSVLGCPWRMLERSSFASLSSAVTARRSRWLATRARQLPHSPPL
jgi:hypothetical protein